MRKITIAFINTETYFQYNSKEISTTDIREASLLGGWILCILQFHKRFHHVSAQWTLIITFIPQVLRTLKAQTHMLAR